MAEVTQISSQIEQGDPSAAEQLLAPFDGVVANKASGIRGELGHSRMARAHVSQPGGQTDESNQYPSYGLSTKRIQKRSVAQDSFKQFPTAFVNQVGLPALGTAGRPLWKGMAWCIIFGLIAATLLTLLVAPAVHAILVEAFGVKPVHVETVNP